MSELMQSALAHARSRVAKAAELLGDASAEEISLWRDSADQLARQHGVESAYTQLAGELISAGVPDRTARIAAYWAARRFFGLDQRAAAELDGPSDWDLESQRLALLVSDEEAETERFYREDFPAIAAARGERHEDSLAWRIFAGGEARELLIEPALESLRPSLERQVDWSAERIRDEYERFWTTAERALFNAEVSRVRLFAASEIEANRYAARRVLDRRVALGTGRPFFSNTAARVSP